MNTQALMSIDLSGRSIDLAGQAIKQNAIDAFIDEMDIKSAISQLAGEGVSSIHDIFESSTSFAKKLIGGGDGDEPEIAGSAITGALIDLARYLEPALKLAAARDSEELSAEINNNESSSVSMH